MTALLKLQFDLEFQIAIRWKEVKRFLSETFRFLELVAS